MAETPAPARLERPGARLAVLFGMDRLWTRSKRIGVDIACHGVALALALARIAGDVVWGRVEERDPVRWADRADRPR